MESEVNKNLTLEPSKEFYEAHVSSIETHCYQQESSHHWWEESFGGGCHPLLQEWMVAFLVLSLAFANQWREWSKEQDAVKGDIQKIIMNNPKLLLHQTSGYFADQTHLCLLKWLFYWFRISILWLYCGVNCVALITHLSQCSRGIIQLKCYHKWNTQHGGQGQYPAYTISPPWVNIFIVVLQRWVLNHSKCKGSLKIKVQM